MKRLITGLRNALSTKQQTPFVAQWQKFKKQLTKQQKERLEHAKWIVCLGHESATDLSQLLDLNDRQLVNEGLVESYFGLYRGCVIHFISNFPDQSKTHRQLSNFYQQTGLINELIFFSFVTTEMLNEPSSLMKLLCNKLALVEASGKSDFEVVLSLSDSGELEGADEYLQYCEKAKEKNKVSIRLNQSLKQQLYAFELQRRDCLLICSPQDYLNTVYFISTLIAHVDQIHKTLQTIESGIPEVNYFFSPEHAFAAITKQT